MKPFAAFSMRSVIHQHLLEAGLIAAALILPFGIQIGRLGLYGDDWASVLVPKADNSPFTLAGLANTVLIQVAGTQPILYHLVSIILLFITGLLLHNLLIQIGLDRVSAIGCVLLFLLFPGFLQPASALGLFSILIGLIFTFLSVHFYLKWATAINRKLKFLVIGLFCSIAGFFFSPYSAAFIGFTFLFLLLRWEKNQIRKRVYAAIIGAGLLLGGFGSFLLYSPERINLSTGVLIRTTRVWLDAFIVCWRQVLAVPQRGRETAIYLLVMVIASLSLIWLFKMMEKTGKKLEGDSKPVVIAGDIVILICSAMAGFVYLLLIIIAGFSIEIRYPNDLGMVVPGIMAAIFVVLGIKLIFLSKYRIVVLALLIVLAAGARYSLINRYSLENSRVENLFAQMAVRGDYFQAGSLLISEQLPFDFTSQKAIDALIRNRFNVEKHDTAVMFVSADNPDLREFLRAENRKEEELRIDSMKVPVNKEKIIGFWMPQQGCLQMLDKNSDLPGLPQGLKLVAPISRPELFETTNLSDVKQLNQFRTKIESDWCFYFELANRQVAEGKWKEVLQTYKNAEELGHIPQSLPDFLPLLRASLQENLIPKSIELSKGLIAYPEQKDIICNLWKSYRAKSDLTEEVITEVEQAQIDIGCL
jgi:hypothetical protein